jgi:hypothetical protein
LQIWIDRDAKTNLCGSSEWLPAIAKPWLSVHGATRTSTGTVLNGVRG